MTGQFELALGCAPEAVRAHGLRAAHPRPRVSFGKHPDRPFVSFKVGPAQAWRYPEVQYGDAGSSIAALVLDCDDPRAMGLGLPDLPPFNWMVERPANRHAHVVWTLDRPVHRYPSARPGPLRRFTHVAEYYASAVSADPGYAGVLAHNPAPRLKGGPYRTHWGREAPYNLDQLASVIPFGWEPPKLRRTATGRNCDLFEAGIRWAARPINARLDVLPALMAVNQEFAHPLPLSEVQATARSIERYRKEWERRGWHCPRWIARQAARGRKGGIASGKARRPGSNEELRPWEGRRASVGGWWYRAPRGEQRMALEANTDNGEPLALLEAGYGKENEGIGAGGAERAAIHA